MSSHPPIHTFGRRRGRRLKPGRQALLDEMLPRLRIEPPASGVLDPETLFDPRPQALWLEIGFGAGEHLAAQAARHPELGFIGCEPYVNGVVALLARAREAGLANLRILPGDARPLLERLAPATIARAFVLFPDPWPKRRHRKRRLVRGAFLDLVARALAPGAELRLASDDPDYVAEMLERIPVHPAFRWTARGPADWRIRPPDQPETGYEAWAIGEGRRPAYLTFRRR
jgi:tRNA (guanine-N7-)-methyltransferase